MFLDRRSEGRKPRNVAIDSIFRDVLHCSNVVHWLFKTNNICHSQVPSAFTLRKSMLNIHQLLESTCSVNQLLPHSIAMFHIL